MAAKKGPHRGRPAPTRGKQPIYDRRQANRISLWVLGIVAAVLGVYLAVQMTTDPISASDKELRARALFGFSIPLADIREAKLESQSLGKIDRVIGNDAFGLFQEGDYEVGGLGKARVFLKRPDVSYIVIRTEDKDYVLSLGSLAKDQLLYDKILLGMKK